MSVLRFTCLTLLLCSYPQQAVQNDGPFSCFTYGYDVYVKCTWEMPSIPDQPFTVKWRIVQLSLEWYDCPNLTPTYCLWNLREDYDVDNSRQMDVCLISNSSTFNSTSFNSTRVVCSYVDIPRLVKPIKIKKIDFSFNNTSCYTTRWSHLTDFEGQVYRVIVSSKKEQHKLFTNSTYLTICEFAAFTTYNISVSARPRDHTGMTGYWSDPTTQIFRTQKAVPSRAPNVTDQTFSSTVQGNGEFRRIDIYFQELNGKWHNGEHIDYKVSICPLPCKFHYKYTKFTDRSPVSFTVPTNKPVIVRIWSRNEVGLSTTYSEIHIPSQDTLIFPFDIVAMVKESTVDIAWKIDNSESYQAVVYWCQRNCKNILWMNVPLLSLPQLPVPLTHTATDSIQDLRYGVSLKKQHRSSGIVWTKCIIKNHDIPSLPVVQFEFAKPDVLAVKWWFPNCNTELISGLILYYKVYQCSKKDCKDFHEVIVDRPKTSLSIRKNETVCVKVAAVTLHGTGRSGNIDCFTRRDKYEWETLVAIIVSAIAFVLITIFGSCAIRKWWVKDEEIQVPEIPKEYQRPLISNSGTTSS